MGVGEAEHDKGFLPRKTPKLFLHSVEIKQEPVHSSTQYPHRDIFGDRLRYRIRLDQRNYPNNLGLSEVVHAAPPPELAALQPASPIYPSGKAMPMTPLLPKGTANANRER